MEQNMEVDDIIKPSEENEKQKIRNKMEILSNSDFLKKQKQPKWNKIKDIIFFDEFDMDIDDLPICIKYLEFSFYCSFNSQIIHLNYKHLTTIIFNEEYNKPLPSLQGTNIKKITFSSKYNKELPPLQNTKVKYIYFGYAYNLPLPDLQNTKLKYIVFGGKYNKPLPPLQNTNVKYIYFGKYYNTGLPDLQNTKVKIIVFGSSYNIPLPSFENTNVEKIRINNIYYSQPIPNLYYTKLKKIYGLNLNNIADIKTFSFPPTLEKLEITKHIQTQYKYQIIKPVINYRLYYLIRPTPYDISKYYNNCFNIGLRHLNTSIYKRLNPYLLYIIYNKKNHIPYEIYNYIFENYNFSFII